MSSTFKKLLLAGFVAGTLSACGGGAYHSRHAHYPPPPRRAVYATPVRPSPAHVWIAGYRDWRGRRYVWVPGRWVRPPRPYAVWVPGYWTRRGNKQKWIKPQWRW
ncbi:MAG: BcpO-related WXXGXW repeat protein [bacterium]|nr:BcpO-related WXXGXW repeat protein [bacterium]